MSRTIEAMLSLTRFSRDSRFFLSGAFSAYSWTFFAAGARGLGAIFLAASICLYALADRTDRQTS